MSTLNSFGFGRLTKDPVLTSINDKNTGEVKTHVCKFSLAFNLKKGDSEEAHFFDFVIWDTGAQNFAGRAHKGDLVFVEAEPREERWVKDDKPMKNVTFRVNRFKIFEKKSFSEGPVETEQDVNEAELVAMIDKAPF